MLIEDEDYSQDDEEKSFVDSGPESNSSEESGIPSNQSFSKIVSVVPMQRIFIPNGILQIAKKQNIASKESVASDATVVAGELHQLNYRPFHEPVARSLVEPVQ